MKYADLHLTDERNHHMTNELLTRLEQMEAGDSITIANSTVECYYEVSSGISEAISQLFEVTTPTEHHEDLTARQVVAIFNRFAN
jgi:hypothetical protein